MAADRQCQTVVHSKREVRNQTVQSRRRADLRKRRVAQHMPGNRGVGEVVNLLKQIAQKQWKCKSRQQSGGASDRHIQHSFRARLHEIASEFSI